ncbi:MAG: hypothetical protein RLW62_11900 [Gammaproteobacteria bacterium]
MERLTDYLTRAVFAVFVIGALLGLVDAGQRVGAWQEAACGTACVPGVAASASHPRQQLAALGHSGLPR